jgi:type III pantothenate kinase
MLLAIDIGNTNLVGGLFDGEDLMQTFRIESNRRRTADEVAALLAQIFTLRGVDAKSIDACILASVVPPLTDIISSAIRYVVDVTPLVVGGPGLKTGIRIRYDNPREVGADRIVNAVAAHARCDDAVIVVDFGTATTFDCVSKEGDYLGGVIVPGVQVSLDGLLGRAAKLSRIELAAPPQVIGRNTVHSMQSGILHGYAALVDGLVEKIRKEMEGPVRVLATGGLAALVCAHAEKVEEIVPDLTLEGLRLIYQRNRGDRGV